MPTTDPFARPYCPAAWCAPDYFGCVWYRCSGRVSVYAVRELLSRAALPRAELLHMGVPAWLLDEQRTIGFEPAWLDPADVVPLLGRIAWDERFGSRQGAVWRGEQSDTQTARAMGEAVVARFFS